MGLCQSCCGSSSEQSGEEEGYGDRSRLVSNGDYPNDGQDIGDSSQNVSHGGFNNEEGRFGSIPNGVDPYFSHSKGASVPKPYFDENQAALQEILNKMAHEVIDIGVHEVTIEPSDLEERARVYGSKLKPAAHTLAVKYEDKAEDDGLIDAKNVMNHSDNCGLLDESEAVLISEISARAQGSTSNAEFQFQNASDIIAHFGDANPTNSSDNSYSSPFAGGMNKTMNSLITKSNHSSEGSTDPH